MRVGRVVTVCIVGTVRVSMRVTVTAVRMCAACMCAACMCVMTAVISMSMPPKPANRHPRESNTTERECGEIYVH